MDQKSHGEDVHFPNFSGNLVAARPEAFEFLVCSPPGFGPEERCRSMELSALTDPAVLRWSPLVERCDLRVETGHTASVTPISGGSVSDACLPLSKGQSGTIPGARPWTSSI